MTKIPQLLELPAAPAARLICLWHIGDIEVAIARLQMQSDVAAYTQLYRALSRVYAALRAYSAYLNESVSKKQLRALADLLSVARAPLAGTAAVKFLEQLDLDLDAREAAEPLMKRLLAQRDEAVAKAARIAPEFEDLARRWRKSLRSYKVHLDPDELPRFDRFCDVALRSVAATAQRLQRVLEIVDDVDDDIAIAKARRTSERLIHRIEPVTSMSPAFSDSSRGLGQLEGLLLSLESANACLRVARDSEPGTARAVELLEQRRARLWHDLQRVWLMDNDKWFFQRLQKALEVTSPLAVAR